MELEKNQLALRKAELEKDNEIKLLEEQLYSYKESPAAAAIPVPTQTIGVMDDWFDKLDINQGWSEYLPTYPLGPFFCHK